MIISYNWLNEYIPEKIESEKLSKILTSIGLEVETSYNYEVVKGSLKGLIIGEVVACEKHPDADKLKLTKVDTGTGELLQIVCGAPNVAVAQKVVVAMVGTTIYPGMREPVIIKKAKIRGIESQGMICAEDEIGIGKSHEGIIILPDDAKIGMPAAEYFKPYQDIIFEIGLTPNRIDAMSHLGVAKDVCAYLSHHHKKEIQITSPFKNIFRVDNKNLQIEVIIENTDACQRYAGVALQNVSVAESPQWLQDKLISIGVRPINNIVDITNFILYETGQPLHAFNADSIKGNKVIVKNLPENTPFVTLDEKERKLFAGDVMICNAEEPMCMGGVYGGLHSGVTATTKNIFLESAWFNPAIIRQTSFRHGLRTDAAIRFEKGIDINNITHVLKRAAMMIKEIAGGEIASDIIDVYPKPKEKTEITLKYHYLKKLSGKNYHSDTIKNILNSLGFELLKEGLDEMRFSVPFSKPDVTIPADIVEEIMRIDGLDNIEIPTAITITPSIETLSHEMAYKEKVAAYLAGLGFNEIFTNSITNKAYFDKQALQSTVKMINSLSEELNVMKPSMLETGLEAIAYNVNRKNNDLQFFEFGKTYAVNETQKKYIEKNHLSLYVTGKTGFNSWKKKSDKADIFFLKGVAERIIQALGLKNYQYHEEANGSRLSVCLQIKVKNQEVATIGMVSDNVLRKFDVKQPVLYADVNWDKLLQLSKNETIVYTEIPKYPAAQRDLAIVVDKSLKYIDIEKVTHSIKIDKLKAVNLFDVFESEKLGANKKSMAINFTFLDEEKTLTDKEIDSMMSKIIASYEKQLHAEVRK